VTTFPERFVNESIAILQLIDVEEVEALAAGLAAVRKRGGRLLVLGVGVRPGTPVMQSTTSARSLNSRPTHRPTMCRSSQPHQR
jgi:hypothetical protein